MEKVRGREEERALNLSRCNCMRGKLSEAQVEFTKMTTQIVISFKERLKDRSAKFLIK